MSQPAVFLDRDGVLNEDHGYVHAIDDFVFVEGAVDACRKLKQKGYLLVMVTNQSGIARGMFSEDQFLQLTEWVDWNLVDRGAPFDGIYYCPHHPEGKVEKYRQKCNCRKPAPGMILDAAKSLDIDLANSYLVGDKLADIQAGQAAGVGHCLLVRTGKPVTDEGEQLAEQVMDSLVEVADWVPQAA